MYAKEYIEYLAHFHGDRDYFECHEILEEYWKVTDPGNKQSILVGFILLAVSNYHHRRGNFRGATRTLKKAYSIFANQKEALSTFGIDEGKFFKLLEYQKEQVETFKNYTSIMIPLADKQLEDECKQVCQNRGYHWGSESDLNNEQLVHRHSKRDRSDVISERIKALKERQNKSRE